MDEKPLPPDDGAPIPRKLTLALIEGYKTLISQGHFREVACRKLGIRHDVFRRWMALGSKYPGGIYATLRHTIHEAEADAEHNMLALIIAGAASDPKHAEWYLERKFPQRWGRTRGDFAKILKELAELKKAQADALRQLEERTV